MEPCRPEVAASTEREMVMPRTVRVVKLVALLCLLIGCATQSRAPTMPKYTTEHGKACGRTCQTAYSQCNQACGVIVGGIMSAHQREQRLDNCNTTLGNCYSTCE